MNSFISSPSATHLKNNLFKKAYSFLILNWVIFFLTFGLVLQGIIPSFPMFLNFSAGLYLAANLATLALSYFLATRITYSSYPTNLGYMLSFAAFMGWLCAPMLQSVIALDLLPLIFLAFGGMLLILLFLQILSICAPTLPINLSLFGALIFVVTLLEFIALHYQMDMLAVTFSIFGLISVSLFHLISLQRIRGIYLKYGDSNEEAVRLSTILFSNSLSLFIRLLRILILLSKNQKSKRNR